MSKSHVTLFVRQCILCGKETDRYNDGLGLETRINRISGELKQTLDPKTIVGWGICETCRPDGFVALLESSDGKEPDGRAMALRENIFEKIFSVPLPNNEHNMVLLTKDAFDKILSMREEQ